MTAYAVGDIQGCFDQLIDVLEQASFNPEKDTLWVAGDIVNRGGKCRETLEFLYQHRHSVRCVLGNHDLHLLAVYYGLRAKKRSDTFGPILRAKKAASWMRWLRQQPLCYYDKELNYCMAHAGLAPQWSLHQALNYSAEVQQMLQGRQFKPFLAAMYGNEPAIWNSRLRGNERLRCITNYFTRMRIVSRAGALDLKYNGDQNNIPTGYYPWFSHPERKNKKLRVIFGHWAALGGHVDHKYLFGLDTGCVWGRALAMMNLETQDFYIAQSSTKYKPAKSSLLQVR